MFKTGFSLIELLVVITIIGVIAAIAVPVYKNYRLRAAFSSGLVLLDKAKEDAIKNYEQFNTVLSSSTSSAIGKYLFKIANEAPVPNNGCFIGDVILLADSNSLNALGITGVTYVNFYYFIKHYNGTIQIYCIQDDDFVDNTHSCATAGTCVTSCTSGTWNGVSAFKAACN